MAISAMGLLDIAIGLVWLPMFVDSGIIILLVVVDYAVVGGAKYWARVQ